MPRDIGTGLYTYPSGTPGNPGQTVFSARYNTFINDLSNTLNQALPINMGGTGATSAVQARDNLDVERAMQGVTNFDTHAWENGSFYANPGATSSPVPANYFIGTYIGEGTGQAIVLAYDISNVDVPHPLYVRQQIGGVWQSWNFVGSDQVNVGGDTMTGNLEIQKDTPALILDKTANGQTAVLQGRLSNVQRWEVALGNQVMESGSNLGSDFAIYSYTDAGAFLSGPLYISRSTGIATFSQGIKTNAAASECQFGGPAITGVFNDGTTVAVRAHGSGSVAIQSGSGGANYASFTPSGTILNGLSVINTAPVSNQAAVVKVTFPNTAAGMAFRPNADTVWALYFENASGTGVGTISTTPTATAYNTSSDERLKEDLKSFDAGHIVDDTNVYDFAWKSTGERSFGIIAQQANEVYPAAVNYNAKEDWWGIDYSKYVPVILQELKALRARVAELEGRLEAGATPA